MWCQSHLAQPWKTVELPLTYLVILRQSMLRMQASDRWVPTGRMLADSLTKNAGDPAGLLRACIKEGKYQISPEATVLKMQQEEKQRRLEK